MNQRQRPVLRAAIGAILALLLAGCSVTYLPGPSATTSTVTFGPLPATCAIGRVGVTVDENLVIVGMVQGGPAFVSGLRLGDRVAMVAGVPVLTIEEAQRRAAGAPGTSVAITVIRPGERVYRTFTVVRICL